MRLLIVLLLTASCLGDTLTLEFAQEGDPGNPRALIVVHNIFEDRDAFKPFLAAWDDRSWARDQFCSVYCFEYRDGGLSGLRSPEELGKELYSRISRGQFKKGRADDINPGRRPEPSDERQPDPSLKEENVQLLFAGYGYGGLVAREAALLAKKNQRKAGRVAYIGTPLDGLSTIDLILGLTVQERARNLGLSSAVSTSQMRSLSEGWWQLTSLFQNSEDWASYFAPLLQDTFFYAGYGTQARTFHPSENLLYGRNARIADDGKGSDGFLPIPVDWGKQTGPVSWIKETVLQQTPMADLTEKASAVTLELPDKEVLHAYLAMRENIETMVKGEGDLPPVGVYWDERHNRWMNAYASKKGLYEMMWGVGP